MKKIKNNLTHVWKFYYLFVGFTLFLLVLTPAVYGLKIAAFYSIEKYVFYALTLCALLAVFLQITDAKKFE
jgi:hypothetical protein